MPKGYGVYPARKWSATELGILREYADLYPVPFIAKKLKRTCRAIRQKLWTEGLSTRTHSGWYTSEEASRILGVGDTCISSWLRKGYLKYELFDGKRYKITEKELKRFIIRFAPQLCGRDVDIVQIVAILSGDQCTSVNGIGNVGQHKED